MLDLSELEFIDSMGIHFVVTAHQAAQAEGREFTIVRGGPEVDRIFQLVGLGDVLPFEDAARALAPARRQVVRRGRVLRLRHLVRVRVVHPRQLLLARAA